MAEEATTIKRAVALRAAATTTTTISAHRIHSMRLSNRHSNVHLLSSLPPSNNPWLAWPTTSKVKAAEDEEHEEEAHRQDSWCRGSPIAPIKLSAERSIGQQQVPTATAPSHSPTG